MLKHNLLIIYRNIKRHKNAFLINLVGLSTGLACFLFIYLWVNNELNFDRFHEKNTWLYQVMANHNNADRIVTMENTPDLLAETIAKELPEIEYATSEISSKLLGKFVVSIKDKFIKADGQFAGKDYFNIFSYKLIEGNKNQVLQDKNSIVISKQLAEKLFSTTKNIIGKTIDWGLLNINEKAVVSGVFEDTPPNSSAQFEFVLSFEAWKDFSAKMNRPISWDNHAPSTYFTLKEGSSIEQLNKKIAGFIKAKYDNSRVTLFTRKYSDGYLYGKYENGRLVGGRIEYVRIFSIMAIFILLIACINFMNLSTAKAGSRLKEIGIKKAVGADRKSLIFQFMVESTFMAFLSLLIAVVLVELFLPQFNEITGKHIAIIFNSNFILLFSAIVLITGLLSGSYPALYLSRFNPVKILKSKTNSSNTELFARRGLVIFQFTLSIILIISVIVINKQIQFIQTKNPGYERERNLF